LLFYQFADREQDGGALTSKREPREIGTISRVRDEAGMAASLRYDPVRMTGFSYAQLARAFETVRNPLDWKGPIFADIPEDERRVVQKAVLWFTGTMPVFVTMPSDAHRLMVTAVGYRLGPAGALVEAGQ
jgi:hypothetical protein